MIGLNMAECTSGWSNLRNKTVCTNEEAYGWTLSRSSILGWGRWTQPWEWDSPNSLAAQKVRLAQLNHKHCKSTKCKIKEMHNSSTYLYKQSSPSWRSYREQDRARYVRPQWWNCNRMSWGPLLILLDPAICWVMLCVFHLSDLSSQHVSNNMF